MHQRLDEAGFEAVYREGATGGRGNRVLVQPASRIPSWLCLARAQRGNLDLVGMTRNFHESLQDEALRLPSERSTGFVFAAIAVIAAIICRENLVVATLGLAMAAVLVAVSVMAPRWLAPLNRSWFALSALLSRIISPVVLFVLFCATIVPFGLGMQLVRDPLRRKRSREQESYWIVRRLADAPSSMKNQF